MSDESVARTPAALPRRKRSGLGWLIGPHPAVQEIGARRQAQFTIVLALIMAIAITAAAVATLRVNPSIRSLLSFGLMVPLLVAAYVISRTRAFALSGYLIAFPILISSLVDLYTRPDLTSAALSSSLLSSVPVAFIIASALLNIQAYAVLILMTSLAILLLPILQPGIPFQQSVQASGGLLTSGLVLLAIVAYRNQTERRRLGDLQRANAELLEIQSNLEAHVQDRTEKLNLATLGAEKRNRQLQAIASVAATIAQMRDLDQLLLRITTLLSESLGFYHIGIFLLDEANQYAVLRSSNSAGGQKMLERAHRLKVGETGIVGYAASTGKPRIATDVGVDVVFFNNPDLPDTKSEMALPLLIGDRLIGVLDMQSREPSAFQEGEIEIFQTLADQIAVAIENARLFSETTKALTEAQKSYTEFVRGSWIHFLQARNRSGYRLAGQEITPVDDPITYPEIEQALQSGEVVIETKKHSAFAIPLVIMGETVGVLDIRMPAARKWTEESLDIVRKISERATLALDNARLVEEAQKRAASERAISEIATKISASVNLSNILQTTAEELGRALPGSEIIVQLESPESKRPEPGA